ncbi:hypothetical protein PZ897_11470 [Hoeflea sp. YIM 152468]|uniref:hypothetical protein n=1 Tax=Hoeflea sp. YIM 152468 TaxID=3031759 RepID=UPI0023DB39F1|nr:hypothetical protein [Hoeflea sp. YIM 152468]MDF1608797.1 hypothetical protein [Hoeflea sp. YIM 152468]
MTRFAILSAFALSSLIPVAALAQESATHRFIMEKSETGFVRMDVQTGEMSICTEQSGQLVCKISADERRAFEDSLSQLSGRVADLEARLDALDHADGSPGATDEAELDRALGTMEKMMRRFFGMVDELRKDYEDGPDVPPEPVPDRT